MAQFEQRGWGVEVFQPEAAQRDEHATVAEAASGLLGYRGRAEHLAAVRGRGDAGGLVHPERDVAVAGRCRGVAVQAHPAAQREPRGPVLRGNSELGA